jgi:hypothetical protein
MEVDLKGYGCGIVLEPSSLGIREEEWKGLLYLSFPKQAKLYSNISKVIGHRKRRKVKLRINLEFCVDLDNT